MHRKQGQLLETTGRYVDRGQPQKSWIDREWRLCRKRFQISIIVQLLKQAAVDQSERGDGILQQLPISVLSCEVGPGGYHEVKESNHEIYLAATFSYYYS